MGVNSECMICEKHRDLRSFTGEPIAERDGWLLTHFPFLETEKAVKGRLVLETRRHITEFDELDEKEAAALGSLIQVGTKVLKTFLKAQHVYVFRINDKVPHLHFHLIPRFNETPKEYWGLKITDWPDSEALSLTQIVKLSDVLRKIS